MSQRLDPHWSPASRIGLALWVLACAGPAWAGFSEPWRITPEGQAAGTFDLGVDFFKNVSIAHEENGLLNLETRGPGVENVAPVGPGDDPRLAFNLLGSFAAYSAPLTDAGGDRKVFVRSKVGAQWTPAVQFSDGEGDDGRVQIQVTQNGPPSAVWERRVGESPARIWFRRGSWPAVELGRGEQPAFVVDGAGRAHVFFLRDDDIFYARESSTQPGLFPQPKNVTQTPFVYESKPSVGIQDQKRVFLCYAREGKVYFAEDRSSDFSKPIVVADGGAAHPVLAISTSGAVAIAFEKAGDIHFVLGATFFLPPPQPAFVTKETETDPVIAIDSLANVYLGFRRGGALYFANNASVPQAKFTADRLKGEAPLTVSFTDKSSGSVTGWTWDFGDEVTASTRNPVHEFQASGAYKVRLVVSGPGGVSPIAEEQTVLVLDPRNQMRVADVGAFPGQQDLHVPVLVTHDKATQGFTIAASYDPGLVRVESVVFEDSNIHGLNPELFAVSISDDPVDPFVTAGILFDVGAPFDGRLFPPGRDQRIANIIASVSPGASPGSTTKIQLRNQVGNPPLNNIFTVNGFTVLPILIDGGTVQIRRLPFPPPRFFLRGDADGNQTLNLTDAIQTLNYLFVGGPAPDCADAADVTDDGSIDVSDATFLLSFLFKSGSFPPPPYPDMGLDPTLDELTDCLLR